MESLSLELFAFLGTYLPAKCVAALARTSNEIRGLEKAPCEAAARLPMTVIGGDHPEECLKTIGNGSRKGGKSSEFTSRSCRWIVLGCMVLVGLAWILVKWKGMAFGCRFLGR